MTRICISPVVSTKGSPAPAAFMSFRVPLTGLALLCAASLSACGGSSSVAGAVSIDGSSTVNPFVVAGAKKFQAANPKTNITILETGTSVGLERVCKGEVDIALASRGIKPKEQAACDSAKRELVELQVANDGIAVIAHPSNKVDCVELSLLRRAWDDKKNIQWSELIPESTVGPISFFGTDAKSGTRDLFAGFFGGDDSELRDDYVGSVDVNEPVSRVAANPGGFGFTASTATNDTVKVVTILNDLGTCVAPGRLEISSGRYPLSRSLYVYVQKSSFARPEVASFVASLIKDGAALADESKLIGLTSSQRQTMMFKLEDVS
jgi:phosphate transport system substrate-binding protein